MAFDQFRGRLFSPEVTADSTSASISQVHRWISDGKIKAVKLGYRMTRIDGDSLADFLASKLNADRPARGKHRKVVSTKPIPKKPKVGGSGIQSDAGALNDLPSAADRGGQY